MSIWITRPLEQSVAMAAAMKQPTITAPVQEIAYLNPAIEGTYDAVITTSQHGTVGVTKYHDLPLYTVGDASVEAAQANGFTLATALSQDAVGLAAMVISSQSKPARFLYLSGRETRVDIAKLLESQGHIVTTVVTYEALPKTTLPDTLLTNWKQVTGVVLMSVGAAKAVQALTAQHKLNVSGITAFCISTTVAAAAGALPWAAIHISESPTQQSLIEAMDASIKT